MKNVTATLRLYSSDVYDQAMYKWIAGDAVDCSAGGMGLMEEGCVIIRDEESGFMVDEFALDSDCVGNFKLYYQFFGKKCVLLMEF